MGNIVKAAVGGHVNEITTAPLYQYDYGQILKIEGMELPTGYQVHFSNEPYGTSTTSIGTADGVEIPDAYLQTGADVYAWLFLQTGEDDGETVKMIRIPVQPRAAITNDEPTPVQQGEIDQLIAALNLGVDAAEDAAEAAEAALDALQDMGVEAETLAAGSSAKVEKTVDEETGEVTLTFGIPKGDKGDKGDTGSTGSQGPAGQDGTSPVASVSKSGSTATITITDKNGTTSTTISDGEDGADGQDGADGYTPVKGTDYWTAEDKAEIVADAAAAAASGIIDDTAGDGDTGKTWSADKLHDEFSTLNGAINGKYTKPSSGIPATDLASGVIPSVPVTDVQVNGTSILSQGVANVPLATSSSVGVVKTTGGKGIDVDSSGNLCTDSANANQIKAGTQGYNPIVSGTAHTATFYGLAKASGDTSQSASSNAVGTYTADALVKIQKMLGIYEAPWELIRQDAVTNATEADILITVDGNGNAFELTDIRGMIWFPTQNNEAKCVGGAVMLLNNGTTVNGLAVDTKTVNANSTLCGAYFMMEQKDGMMFHQTTGWHNQYVMGTVRMTIMENRAQYYHPFKIMNETAIDTIKIPKITGTMNYIIYGKRKWRT